MNKKVSKGMRIQMCALAGIKTFDNSHTSISDILPKDVRPEEIESIMIDWLDEFCSNGYTSRWTNFGINLMIDADRFKIKLTSIYRRFDL